MEVGRRLLDGTDADLFVPEESLSAYRTDYRFSQYADRIISVHKNLLTKVKSFSAGFYISHDSIFVYNNKAGIITQPERTCFDLLLLIDCHYSRVIDSQELI